MVQAPQTCVSHERLVPVSPRSSRRTSSRIARGSISSETSRPFTVVFSNIFAGSAVSGGTAITLLTGRALDGGSHGSAANGPRKLARVRRRLEDVAASFDLIPDDVSRDGRDRYRSRLPAQDRLGFGQPLRTLADTASDYPGIGYRAVVDRDHGGDRGGRSLVQLAAFIGDAGVGWRPRHRDGHKNLVVATGGLHKTGDERGHRQLAGTRGRGQGQAGVERGEQGRGVAVWL